MKRLLAICGCWLAFAWLGFTETLPSKPARYFNDLAGVVSAQTAAALDARLQQFEKETSNQFVVAVYPKLDTTSSIQDFTYRIAESWKVGQKERKNGVVLFVFIAEHKMFIQVGYGLEGALPDVLCKRIIAEQIAPAFKTGRFDAGLAAGVESIIKATRGEYRGTGATAGRRPAKPILPLLMFFGFIAFLVVMRMSQRHTRGRVYGSGGGFGEGLMWGILSNLGRGGGGGGGGTSGGGSGGGFSGGGGSFGGGGAGGDW